MEKRSENPEFFDDLEAEGTINPDHAVSDLMEKFSLDRFYLDCFLDLSTARTVGMGISPISIIDIIKYGQFYEIEDIDLLKEIIFHVDRLYLSEKNKKDTEEKDGKGPS